MSDVRWTEKLATLAIGLAVCAIGVSIITKFIPAQHFRLAGIALILIGVGFVSYSLSVKQWCGSPRAFNTAFHSQSFESCLRQKGWLAF